MDLFAGLEELGISGIDSESLFAEEESKKNEVGGKVETVPVVEPEENLIYDKSYTCPICDKEFKEKVVRGNKAKLIGTDLDLRPIYENIEVLKYDVVACPECGYAALSRYFGPLAGAHVRLIRQGICEKYIKKERKEDTYSYDIALERYKLALANAVVRKAKPSEKSYICLKTAWLLRSKNENETENSDEAAVNHQHEEAYLKNAYTGFVMARQSEVPPICGMDGPTLDYLLAVLALHFKEYEVSAKLLSELLVNKTVSNRVKDKARDLKEMLLNELKANGK